MGIVLLEICVRCGRMRNACVCPNAIEERVVRKRRVQVPISDWLPEEWPGLGLRLNRRGSGIRVRRESNSANRACRMEPEFPVERKEY